MESASYVRNFICLKTTRAKLSYCRSYPTGKMGRQAIKKKKKKKKKEDDIYVIYSELGK